MSTKSTRETRIRAAFLTAAHDLIMERGYDAVTVTAIAARADYGRSTFYLYFESKAALVWAMLAGHMTALDAQIQDVIAPHPSPVREWLAWRAIFREILAQRSVFLQLNGDMAQALWSQQRTHLITLFEQQLRDGVFSLLLDDTPPEIAARFVVGALLELLSYSLTEARPPDPDQMANHMFRLVFRQEPPNVKDTP